MKLFTADVPIYATIYIKASSLEEAQAKFAKVQRLSIEVPECDGDVPISDTEFDNPFLPEVSLGTAMSFALEPIALEEHAYSPVGEELG